MLRYIAIVVVVCFSCVAISPLAAQENASERQAITVSTANRLAILRTPSVGSFTGVAWSPESSILAITSQSNEVILYDVEADSVAQTFSFGDEDARGLVEIAFTPDGARLVGLQKINVAPSTNPNSTDNDDPNSILWVWDAKSGEVLRQRQLTIHDGTTYPLVLNPSGTLVFVGGNYSGSQLVSLSTDESIPLLLGDYAPQYPSISPDFERVVFVYNGLLYGYELVSGASVFTSDYFGEILPNAPNQLNEVAYTSIAISADSQIVAVVGALYGNANPDLPAYRFGHLYDLATGDHLRALAGKFWMLEQPAFNHDSTIIAAYGCSEMRVVSDEGFSSDYRACVGVGVFLWDVTTGQQVGFIPFDEQFSQIDTLSFSLDGKWLVLSGPSGLRIYGVSEPINRADFAERNITACEILSEDGSLINQRAAPDGQAEVIGQLGSEEVAQAVQQTVGADGQIWWGLESGAWVRSDVVVEAGLCANLPTPIQPTPTSEITLCNSDLPSHLMIGQAAQVTFTNGEPLNLRDAPGNGAILLRMEEGTPMTVLDGPNCLNGVAWWQVELEDQTIGWAAEGADGVYYLEPQ